LGDTPADRRPTIFLGLAALAVIPDWPGTDQARFDGSNFHDILML
jgi:hypothetical protein